MSPGSENMTGRKILALNIVILSAILFCTQHLISGWQRFEERRHPDQPIRKLLSKSDPSVEDVGFTSQEEDLQHDFFVIAERNLFSPERRPKMIDEAGQAPAEAPEFPKEPKLSGITEKDGKRSALLRVYDSKKDRGEPLRVGIGDPVQGWVVTEIADTTLTLSWNDQQVVIDMLDSEPEGRVPSRTKQQVASVNIIRVGSKVAAVETTTPEPPEAEEDQGLQVGVVGRQAASRSRSRSSLAGRGVAGRNSLAGRSGRQSGQGRSLPSTVGGVRGFGQQALPGQR